MCRLFLDMLRSPLVRSAGITHGSRSPILLSIRISVILIFFFFLPSLQVQDRSRRDLGLGSLGPVLAEVGQFLGRLDIQFCQRGLGLWVAAFQRMDRVETCGGAGDDVLAFGCSMYFIYGYILTFFYRVTNLNKTI